MNDPNMPGVLTDLGPIRDDTKKVAYEVVKAAAAAGHQLFFVWGTGDTGDHKHGIAIDFMVYDRGDGVKHPGPERPAVGTWVANYVWDNRERLGVRYEIYNRRIRSTTGTPPNVWLDYDATDDPHTNHVHVSRLSNAQPYRMRRSLLPDPPKMGTKLFWRHLKWQTENPDRIVYGAEMIALKKAIMALRSPSLPTALGLDVSSPVAGARFVEAVRWVQEQKLHDSPDKGPFPFLGPIQLDLFCRLPRPSMLVQFGGDGDLAATHG